MRDVTAIMDRPIAANPARLSEACTDVAVERNCSVTICAFAMFRALESSEIRRTKKPLPTMSRPQAIVVIEKTTGMVGKADNPPPAAMEPPRVNGCGVGEGVLDTAACSTEVSIFVRTTVNSIFSTVNVTPGRLTVQAFQSLAKELR